MPVTGDLQKKKVFAVSGRRRNPKAFSGQNRKFQRFFRPKTPTNFKKYLGGQEKKYRWGQEKNRGGGIAPLPPRWRRACFKVTNLSKLALQFGGRGGLPLL